MIYNGGDFSNSVPSSHSWDLLAFLLGMAWVGG